MSGLTAYIFYIWSSFTDCAQLGAVVWCSYEIICSWLLLVLGLELLGSSYSANQGSKLCGVYGCLLRLFQAQTSQCVSRG